MSALGQKRTYAVHQPMSALPPIATAKADMPIWSCLLCRRGRSTFGPNGQRDAKKEVELERLQMAIRDNILTPEVRTNGYGGIEFERFEQAIDQIGLAYKFKAKPSVADIFDSSFLPPAHERWVE